MDELARKYEAYQLNVYSGMLHVLSEQLGVSVNAIKKLGVGYDMARGVWVFPERDELGEIIGLALRSPGGKKWSDKGSKRGLTYRYNSAGKREIYNPGSHNWVRLSDRRPDIVCPICGKFDWCLVSADNPKEPRACICQRVSEGSARSVGDGGWLHILRPEGNLQTASVLEASEFPVLVVEGQSDVIAALDLGFVAVGRPSSDGGMNLLKKLLVGRDVCVIGENDEHIDSTGKPSWPGKQGWQITMSNLAGHAHSVLGLFPPDKIKDLRAWLRSGLVHDEFLDYITKHAENVSNDADVFSDDFPTTIAVRFLENFYKIDGINTLRFYGATWVRWKDGCYQELEPTLLDGKIYEFLDGKRYKKVSSKGEIKIETYRPCRKNVGDIIHAFSRWCPIEGRPPQWLNGVDGADPINLITFQNGVLDVTEYSKGHIVLHNPNPNLFSFVSLPYRFDENSDSKLWRETSASICSDKKEEQELLAQWIGYNIIPDMSMEALMLFQGRPASGKGTVLDTMTEILGPRQVCVTSFSSLCGQWGYAPLVGKLAVILGDAKLPKYGDTVMALEKILQITGGDPIQVERRYVDAISLTYLTCRFTLAVNGLPALTDHARALERRLKILYFGNSYVGHENRSLKGQLKKEAAEGRLINYALQGLVCLKKKGEFTIPGSSKHILDQFRSLTAPITTFILDCCDKAPKDVIPVMAEKLGYWVDKSEIYNAWVGWCADEGIKPGSKEQFGQDLLSSHALGTNRVLSGGQRTYRYQGIKLLPWAYAQYLGKPKNG